MSSRQADASSPSAEERRARRGQALGADESVVVRAHAPTPELIGQLAEDIAGRLRSTGGRPSDPNWTMTRQVPFAVATWSRLGQLADDLSARGRRVAPTQLAAILVENGLDGLEEDDAASPAALDRYLMRRARGTVDTDE